MPLTRLGISRYDFWMLVVALIWGANFSANKYALVAVPPIAFSAVRFVIASALLLGLVGYLAPGPPIPGGAAVRLAGLGVIGNTGYQIAFMTGLVTTTAINAALILTAMPIAVAVLGTVFGVERAGARLWLGIVVATLGVGLVVAARGASFSLETLRGDLLILVACLCWSAFTVGIRQVGRGLDPLRVTALTTAAGTPGLVLIGLGQLRATDWLALPAGVWVALLYSAIFAIVVAYGVWSWAVQGIGGSRTALYNCIVPIFAAMVAWVVLGERPVPVQGVGAMLVFAGVFLSQGAATRLVAAVRDRLPGVSQS